MATALGCPRLLCAAASSLIVLIVSGCGQAHNEGKLSGQVLIDGKPLRGGSVMFIPTDPQLRPVGSAIDESGNYGPIVVPEGELQITVDNRNLAPRQTRGDIPLPKQLSPEVRAKIMASRSKMPATPAANPRYTKIPSRYYLAETSDLTFKMSASDQTHNIELSSKP